MKIHINNDDNYATPPELYETLNNMFEFDFDLNGNFYYPNNKATNGTKDSMIVIFRPKP